MNKDIMRAAGFGKEVDKVMWWICPICNEDIGDEHCFRDELSRAEYKISCICQECQDKMFG